MQGSSEICAQALESTATRSQVHCYFGFIFQCADVAAVTGSDEERQALKKKYAGKLRFAELLSERSLFSIDVGGEIGVVSLPARFEYGRESGQSYTLDCASVLYCTNAIGIVRLTFQSDAVSIPDFLAFQQSCVDKGRLYPHQSTSGLSNRKVGASREQGVTTLDLHTAILNAQRDQSDIYSWEAPSEASTAKMFVFSRVLLEGCRAPSEKQTGAVICPNQFSFSEDYMRYVCYLAATFSSGPKRVNGDEISSYLAASAYLRWWEGASGLMLGFAGYGGTAVHFVSRGAGSEGLPKWMEQGQMWQGQSVLAEQVALPILYERTFYLSERTSVQRYIAETENANTTAQKKLLVEKLKDLRGKLLRFKLLIRDGVSESRSCQDIFEIWEAKTGTQAVKNAVSEDANDVANYYNDVASAEQQETLDFMAVVLGFLGVAQLVIDITTSDHPQHSSLIVLASLFVSYVFYRRNLR